MTRMTHRAECPVRVRGLIADDGHDAEFRSGRAGVGEVHGLDPRPV